MTVPTSNNRNDYTGNGANNNFSYTFRITDKSHIRVTVRSTLNVETTLTVDTDYSVAGVGDAGGGSITLINAAQAWMTAGFLTNNFKIALRHKVTLVQNTDIRNQGAFYPEIHEDALDYLTTVDQQQQDEINRSIKLPETIPSSGFDPTIPADFPSTINASLINNDTGTGFKTGPTAGAISAAQSNATAAAASATAAANSATGAATSATNAAASASSASAALNSAFFRDVVYKTSADSPITVAQADNGKLFSIDSSGGPVTINLPTIAGLALPFNVAVALGIAGNNVTINRGGTDTFVDASTARTLSAAGTGIQATADTDKNPDQWATLDFGSVADGAITLAKLDVQVTDPKDARNYSLAASVGANALTIALKDAAGNNPSASSPVKISFRNSTAATGTNNVRSVTGSLSTVISSGSTAGHTSGVDGFIYVYALDNAGAVELCWSASRWDEGTLQTTTAEGGAGAADSSTVLYSTTARANVPIRFLGRMKSNQAAVGTWTSVPTEISILPSDKGVGGQVALMQETQTSGTNGGTFTSGAWRTRTLNNNSVSQPWISGPSSNQFTLLAGTYLIEARAPAMNVNNHQAKLYNVTDAADSIMGSTTVSPSTGASCTDSIVTGQITISATKTFEIRHQCQTTSVGSGFGNGSAFGSAEVYTAVKITKVA